jgi:hypothetical protein
MVLPFGVSSFYREDIIFTGATPSIEGDLPERRAQAIT